MTEQRARQLMIGAIGEACRLRRQADLRDEADGTDGVVLDWQLPNDSRPAT